jgi:hypothetical protein
MGLLPRTASIMVAKKVAFRPRPVSSDIADIAHAGHRRQARIGMSVMLPDTFGLRIAPAPANLIRPADPFDKLTARAVV